MHVRQVVSGDADRLRAVRLAALANAPSSFSSTLARERAYPAAHWVGWADESDESRTGAIFLASQDECLGMAGVYVPDGQAATGVVWGMWVSPPARRRGAGRKLVEALRRWALDRGLERLELEVTEEAAAARALYERCGFAAAGEPVPLAEDPMRLELDPDA